MEVEHLPHMESSKETGGHPKVCPHKIYFKPKRSLSERRRARKHSGQAEPGGSAVRSWEATAEATEVKRSRALETQMLVGTERRTGSGEQRPGQLLSEGMGILSSKVSTWSGTERPSVAS